MSELFLVFAISSDNKALLSLLILPYCNENSAGFTLVFFEDLFRII